MATFQYKAYTAQGAVTAGTIVAEGLDAAIDALYGSGLTPFETYGVADAQRSDRSSQSSARCRGKPMLRSGNASSFNPIVSA